MCIEGRKSAKVDPAKYAEVFTASEQWPEVARWREYSWRLVRNVLVADLEHSTLEEYEAEAETDPEKAQEYRNVERVDEIIALLREGGKLWPVVLGVDCMIVDGYHRLAAAEELGIETINVIYPIRRRT